MAAPLRYFPAIPSARRWRDSASLIAWELRASASIFNGSIPLVGHRFAFGLAHHPTSDLGTVPNWSNPPLGSLTLRQDWNRRFSLVSRHFGAENPAPKCQVGKRAFGTIPRPPTSRRSIPWTSLPLRPIESWGDARWSCLRKGQSGRSAILRLGAWHYDPFHLGSLALGNLVQKSDPIILSTLNQFGLLVEAVESEADHRPPEATSWADG